MTRVLVVDDEPQILRALRINLRVREYEVHVAATGAEALQMASRYPRRPWMTSTPSRSGRPRSRITRSGGYLLAIWSASAPVAATCTS